ncbi:regulatory protein GemA [Aurantimonas sp. C2-6-R+9]|uniref:gp16 family protein n=1 Tax=unclassified Aurantimonas TaxID=2638230 RepID=UPI002E178AF9|nr:MULTISPECIES: regulatory protein GemA [unclassified Aurantimonas]MEC5293705.1 regulatory protein GemA [Aurantimonas sp. C2-3-R2]MEC5383277.1 regulatory protein GemA [Aurantimonas sp. C2-6-R+9]MEC5414243.1 regulatory protein GemA [Aurantimonas sp. C2-4-R8]
MNSHAIIHIAAKQLKLDEHDRRALYLRVTGKPTLTEMTDAQRETVVAEFKRLGFRVTGKGKPKSSNKAYVRLIFALWRSIGEHGGLRDASPAALRSFVEKRTGVTDPDWLTYGQADPLIRALKEMEARAIAGERENATP